MRERVVVWILRITVVALVLTIPLLDSALSDMNDANRVVARVVLWVFWAGLLLCILLPSSSSLTALRLIIPAHCATTLMVAIESSRTDLDRSGIVAATVAIVAVVTAMSGDVGRHWVQLSAYGDERRFPLACPPAMIAVQILTWALWYALAVGAVFAFTSDDASGPTTVLGFVAAIAAAIGAVLLPRRFHRFSRRWLVWVPAGLVVHDHVVLAETAMMSKRSVARVELWHPGTQPEPLDVTGGSGRPSLAVSLHEPETMILAPTKEHPGGHALHVRSFVVRPTRLQPALAELTERLTGR